MPKIDLTFSAGALTDQARKELPPKLGAAMLRAEKAPDTAYMRSITWVHLHELGLGAAFDGDGQIGAPHFAVDVTVPSGALNDRRRESLVGELTALILEAAGLDDTSVDKVWVIVHEIPDGHWGAMGRIIRLADLREIAVREAGGLTEPA